MCLKQLFAKQVPVTKWPHAKALPSTPLLLNIFGMWEKLVTLGLPIVQGLSRLECEHSKASQQPSTELNREDRDRVQPEQEQTKKQICESCEVLFLCLPSFLFSSLPLNSSLPPSLPVFDFVFYSVLFLKGNSGLNVLKMIIKYSWKFLGLGL